MTNAEKLQRILDSPSSWIETFCKIVNKDNKLVPFILNDEQKDFVNNKTQLDIILKSRQIGFSVLNAALSLYYCCTIPNVHCLLASYTLDSANTIYDKLKQIYYSIPDCVKPKEIQNNRKELAFANGSKITVTTIGNKDIARGSSLYFVHLSEFAFVSDDKAKKQLTAIEQSILPDSGGIVIESTANGLNHYYELYNKAENKECMYEAHFYSWLNDYKMHAKEQKEYSEKYKAINGHYLTKEELEPIEKTYLDNGATLQMLMWRRMKISNIGEQQFQTEFPAFSNEAFVSTGATVFDVKNVQLDYNVKKSLKSLQTITTLPQSIKIYMSNYLTIWNEPQSGVHYYISCDSAEGMGGTFDYTVIDVYTENAEQVAQFRSNKIKPPDIAMILNELGHYYNGANIIVENASTGGVILDRLRNMYHYKNLYKYKDWDARGRQIKKVGFKTTPKSKPILISQFVEWYENNDVFIKSTATLKEMKTYVFDGSSTNAIIGQHDDCCIACALVIEAIKTHKNYIW